MFPLTSPKTSISSHIVTAGILLYGILYLIAANLYPGGSQNDAQKLGFDWVHNYWCDLLEAVSYYSGEKNPAMPFAIFAMILLCATLVVFFFRFAEKLATNKAWKRAIQISGTLAMFAASLMFTALHNSMIIVASAFGLVTLLGIFLAVAKSNMFWFKIGGVISAILLICCNVFYYGNIGMYFLPLFQKISLLAVLIWVFALNWTLNKIPSQHY